MTLLNQSIATSEVRNVLFDAIIGYIIILALVFILVVVVSYRDFKRKTFLKKFTKKRSKKRSKKLTRKLIKKLMLKYGVFIMLPILAMIGIYSFYMRDLVNPQVIVVEGYVFDVERRRGGITRIRLQYSEGRTDFNNVRPRRLVINIGDFYRIYYTLHTRTIIHAVLLEEYEVFIDENNGK